MPLIQHTQLLTGAQVWIWHLSETKNDFERFLNPSDISEIFHKIPHETRQLQKMATRALLHQLNPVKRIDIQYDELGAPGLNGHEGHETEKNWIRPDKNLEEITLIWSTKEAMFKTLGGGGIHFSADLIVYEPFFTNPESGHGEALYQGHKGKIAFEYHFKYLDGVLMVHTIAKRTKSEVA
jgi:phosphopantetheinyl transferase